MNTTANRTIDTIRERLAAGSSEAHMTATAWIDNAPTTPAGTMRQWMTEHDGQSVDTLQASTFADGSIREVWAPLAREVDARARAGAVSFNGSWRAYAGCSVVGSNATDLVVSQRPDDDETDGPTIIWYRVSA